MATIQSDIVKLRGKVSIVTLRHIHQMKGNELIDNYTYNKVSKKTTIKHLKQI